MLVTLLGASCSGKDTIARHLTTHESFTRVHLRSKTDSIFESAANSSDSGATNSLIFDTPADFLDHATLDWRNHFVTSARLSKSDLQNFRKRPWVLLVNVEAPLSWRYARSIARNKAQDRPSLSFEDFVKQDDLIMHGTVASGKASSSESSLDTKSSSQIQLPSGPLPLPHPTPTPPATPHLSRALVNGLTIKENTTAGRDEEEFMPLVDAVPLVHLSVRPAAFASTQELGDHLTRLNLASEHRVRPSWDDYFMTLADLASLRSNCMKRRVGAVLISSKRKVVLSTGYNGTPRGMVNCSEGGCSRCNSTSILSKRGDVSAAAAPVRSGMSMEECLCLHAEENALLEAGRERAGAGEGGTLYCNTCPCLRCTVKIVQCGVSEVVYSQSYSMDHSSAEVFRQAGVQLRQIALKREWTQ